MAENERLGPPGQEGPPPPFPEADEQTRFGGARRFSENAGRLIARGGVSAFLGARRFTHSGGAGESGLARLLELHAFNTAGDAAVAVSLAGTLFFTVPTEQASSQVALFLVLTMLPFAVVAPLIGPFLDRFRRGRRWAIGTTLAVRAFCCWVLAGAVAANRHRYPAFVRNQALELAVRALRGRLGDAGVDAATADGAALTFAAAVALARAAIRRGS